MPRKSARCARQPNVIEDTKEQYVRLSLDIEKRKDNLATMERELAELQLQNAQQQATMKQLESPVPMSHPQATRVCDLAEQIQELPPRGYDHATRVYDPTTSVATRLDLNPQVYLGVGNAPHSKYRPIIDFVPRLYEEQEIEIASGVTLRVKGGEKPKVDKITPAQWTVANARIIAEMIRDQQSDCRELTLDYLSYTAKIGEYATRFTWPSMMLFDDDYRRRQAEYGYRWGSDSPHSSHVILRERDVAKARVERTTQQKEVPFCFNYNMCNIPT
jgi:hypothetical protein